ncbi:MAG: WS/DGAT domain-containing protein [Mycobacteriales bacterium]
MVPISLHRDQPGRASGNQDSSMMVPLPMGEPDPVRRLQLIAAETTERKNKAHPQMGSGIWESHRNAVRRGERHGFDPGTSSGPGHNPGEDGRRLRTDLGRRRRRPSSGTVA